MIERKKENEKKRREKKETRGRSLRLPWIDWFSLEIQTPNLICRISRKFGDCREMAAARSPFQVRFL